MISLSLTIKIYIAGVKNRAGFATGHLSLNKLLNDIFQGFFAVTPLSGSNHLPYRPFSTFQAYLQTLSAYLQDFEHICKFSSEFATFRVRISVPKITPDSQNFNEGYLSQHKHKKIKQRPNIINRKDKFYN